MQKILKLFCVSMLTLLAFKANSAVSPEIEWKVLKLPHFDLIYDAKHQELAEVYAHRLEDNMHVLGSYFVEFPEKIAVILNDNTDSTNGYATPIPYDHIMVYPVLPGPSETIGEYGDWARELTMHEYTHILSFEPKRGVVKILHSVFGTVITPNILLPRWWLEGVAVEMETRTSHHGRLRSIFQDASVRAFAQSDRLKQLSLAEINEVTIPTWPYGSRAYLFGSLMWSEMFSLKGKEAVEGLHWRYGGRVPFLIEGPSQDILGLNYDEIFSQMKESLRSRVEIQLETLGEKPFTQGKDINLEGIESFLPVISPDGLKLVYLSKSEIAKRSLKILQRPTAQVPFDGSQKIDGVEQRLNEQSSDMKPTPGQFEDDGPAGGTIQRMSWFPDSKRFIYDKLEEVDKFKEYSDLWIYDLEAKKNTQLTFAARAREACVSPDGKSAAFVELDAGRTHFATINLETKVIKRLYSSPVQGRISNPAYLSNDKVLFFERINGQELIKTMEVNSSNPVASIKPVLRDLKEGRAAVMTSLGLFLVSGENGVFNLYLADKYLVHARPVTHSTTSVLSADYDSKMKELVYTELTENGTKIYRLPEQDWFSKSDSLPKISPLLEARYEEPVKEVAASALPPPTEYSPWNYLLPRYWFPNLIVSNNNTYFSAQTSAFDPLEKHLYTAFAAYDSSIQKGSYNFMYKNNSTRAEVTFIGMDYNTTVPVAGFPYRDQHDVLTADWQILPISKLLTAGGGWRWRSRDFYQLGKTHHQGPTLDATYSDYSMSGTQISPESGHAGSLVYTQYLRNENWQGFDEWNYSLVKYFSKWLPKRHAIMVKFQGQYIDGQAYLPDLTPTFQYSLYANSPLPFLVMRGFPLGQFYGKTINNVNLEYRFPLAYVNRGAGTTPLFIRRLHAAVVADGINLDGRVLNKDMVYQPITRSETLWGGGIELKADLTLGYHFPVTFFAGAYRSLPNDYSTDNQLILGFQSN